MRSDKYLISLFLTSSLFFVLVRTILNYYRNYPTHRLYFEEVETPYSYGKRFEMPLWNSESFINEVCNAI